MLIRPMVESDLPVVYVIECASYEIPWTLEVLLLCFRIGYDCWVLEEDNAIHSYAILSFTKEGAHIVNIATDPLHRHKGFGRKLIEHLIERAKQKKVKVVFLEVRESNMPAIRLYESLGFNQVDVKENYYPKGQERENALIYALDLTYV